MAAIIIISHCMFFQRSLALFASANILAVFHSLHKCFFLCQILEFIKLPVVEQSGHGESDGKIAAFRVE